MERKMLRWLLGCMMIQAFVSADDLKFEVDVSSVRRMVQTIDPLPVNDGAPFDLIMAAKDQASVDDVAPFDHIMAANVTANASTSTTWKCSQSAAKLLETHGLGENIRPLNGNLEKENNGGDPEAPLLGSRILGGDPVDRKNNSAPFSVAIVINQGKFCAGSLISECWVITAAHCMADATSAVVHIGTTNISASPAEEPGKVIIPADLKVVHNLYDRVNIVNDISLLRLVTCVNFTDFIRPVTLPNLDMVNRSFEGVNATICGWGKYTAKSNLSSILQCVKLPVISNANCARAFSFTIDSCILCCGGKVNSSTCNGDSGGGLTVTMNNTQYLVGIVSFGSGQGCDKGFPSAFTRVTCYLDWINKSMAANSPANKTTSAVPSNNSTNTGTNTVNKPITTGTSPKSTKNNPTSTGTKSNNKGNKHSNTGTNTIKLANKLTNTGTNPSNTENKPKNTDNNPNNKENKPKNTDTNSTNTENKPKNTGTNSTNTENKPKNTDNNPNNTGNKPKNTDNNSTNTENKPKNMGTNSTNTENKPKNTDNNPNNKENKPKNTENNPNNKENKPKSTDTNSTNTENKPKNTDNNPNNNENKPKNTDNNPNSKDNKPKNTGTNSSKETKSNSKSGG